MFRPLKTEVKIKIYESNGEETKIGHTEFISILSHWNRGTLVTLVFNNQKFTVDAYDLMEAINRCKYT